jgi:hypothetical protein
VCQTQEGVGPALDGGPGADPSVVLHSFGWEAGVVAVARVVAAPGLAARRPSGQLALAAALGRPGGAAAQRATAGCCHRPFFARGQLVIRRLVLCSGHRPLACRKAADNQDEC